MKFSRSNKYYSTREAVEFVIRDDFENPVDIIARIVDKLIENKCLSANQMDEILSYRFGCEE